MVVVMVEVVMVVVVVVGLHQICSGIRRHIW